MNTSFKILLETINYSIKSFNENDFKIYDEDNPEYFISGIEYNSNEDKLIFRSKKDPKELERLEELSNI